MSVWWSLAGPLHIVCVLSIPIPFAGIVDLEEKEKKGGKRKIALHRSIHPARVTAKRESEKARERERERIERET